MSLQLLLMKTTPDLITSLEPNQFFVFGSNLSGFHAGGAAKQAMKWGAVWGQPTGLQGRTYAIPTKSIGAATTLTIEEIKPHVEQFITDALNHPEKEFLVTGIGCGIAGLKVDDIGPLFKEAINIENIILPKRFIEIINTS